MKKIMRIIVVLVVTASLLTSCHNGGSKLTKYIPKDAYAVFGVNSKSILEKAGKTNISFDSLQAWFGSNGDDTSVKKAAGKWADLKNSGIDLDQEVFAFVKAGGSIMAGNSYAVGFVAGLKDASAFEAYLKKQSPEKEVKKGDNYSYMALGDEYIAGWNDDVAIVAVKHAGSTSPGTYATGEGTLTQQMLTGLFAQKESESVASADGFNEMKTTTDMSFYVNSASQASSSMIDMTKMADLIKGSYSVGTADFEDGTIKMTFTGHSNQAMADLLKKYPYRSIDIDMLDKYPSQVEGFMITSFNPQFITALLKYAGMDAMANNGLQQAGLDFTLDDVVKAFKGDFAIIGSDFGMQTKTITSYGNYKLPEPVVSQVPVFKLLVNTTIADKAAYDKVVSALAAKGIMVLQNGQYMFPDMGDYVMKATDKNLYVASAADVLQQYEAGTAGKSNMPAEIHDRVKGKVAAVYFDVNKILQSVPATGAGQAAMETAKATFKDIIATFDNLDGSTSTGNMEFRFMNEKENSLSTLIKFGFAEAKLMKDKTKAYNEMPQADSMGIPPPPPPSK